MPKTGFPRQLTLRLHVVRLPDVLRFSACQGREFGGAREYHFMRRAELSWIHRRAIGDGSEGNHRIGV